MRLCGMGPVVGYVNTAMTVRVPYKCGIFLTYSVSQEGVRNFKLSAVLVWRSVGCVIRGVSAASTRPNVNDLVNEKLKFVTPYSCAMPERLQAFDALSASQQETFNSTRPRTRKQKGPIWVLTSISLHLQGYHMSLTRV